jgi:hypothetical protein
MGHVLGELVLVRVDMKNNVFMGFGDVDIVAKS